MKEYKYYFVQGMLIRVTGETIQVMIEGKGWMIWLSGKKYIEEKNIITTEQAERIVLEIGESF